MIYHSRRVRCPKCNEIIDRNSTDRTFTLFGSPYRVCPCCGANYFDFGYHELAIDTFNDKGVLTDVWQVVGLLVFNGAAAGYIISGMIKTPGGQLTFVLLSALALIADYLLIKTIQNMLNAEAYHQEQIDLMEGRYGEMSEELAESMQRMSDRKYLDALRSHGVDVPEYFYKRLGSAEGSFVEPEGVIQISILNVIERDY